MLSSINVKDFKCFEIKSNHKIITYITYMITNILYKFNDAERYIHVQV